MSYLNVTPGCHTKFRSIFFYPRLSLHDIFFSVQVLARYFFWNSTYPPIKNQMVRPLVNKNREEVEVFIPRYSLSLR